VAAEEEHGRDAGAVVGIAQGDDRAQGAFEVGAGTTDKEQP
jgi:hypothetical protein